jgi:hypothetical protein
LSRLDRANGPSQPATDGYDLALNPVSSLGMEFDRMRGGVKELVHSTGVPNGVWSHIVATYDAVTLRLYLNGLLVDAKASGVQISDLTNPLVVGAGTGGSTAPYSGGIDEFAVYDHVLAEQRILVHYQVGSGK